MVTVGWYFLLVVLCSLLVLWRFAAWLLPVSSSLVATNEKSETLFVLVHGLWGSPETSWEKKGGVRVLKGHGDVLAIRYPAFPVSNADADEVSRQISESVQAAWKKKEYKNVVLVGHSMGALITRKAFLYACNGATLRDGEASARADWAEKVERIVLLAGTNRGVDISGQKPMDMNWPYYLVLSGGSWLGELTDTARLARSMEAGAPFVANLRLEWMNWYRGKKNHKPPVIQLLGDIDDVVSEADNMDLHGTGSTSKYFTWLEVRGTGHNSILHFDDQASDSGLTTLGKYRSEKFERAATAKLDDLRKENEKPSPGTDEEVTHVVFILHGIRDLGLWSAEFEPELRKQFKDSGKVGKLAIVSIRYGYFGMGPFLLRRDRQKYVRWFMDEYTETLARYPNLDPNLDPNRIDFVGHSNGTYLLTSALQRYRTLKVNRVVFGGSVVRKDYPWKDRIKHEQVKLVRNYVASDDAVVALLPRFFEPRLTRWLNDDLGSAGFNGFHMENGEEVAGVENIEFITGHHGAFLNHVPSIVEFLMSADGTTRAPISNDKSKYDKHPHSCSYRLLQWASWACWIPWLVAVVLVVIIGFVARQLGLFALLAYIIFLLWFLTGF